MHTLALAGVLMYFVHQTRYLSIAKKFRSSVDVSSVSRMLRAAKLGEQLHVSGGNYFKCTSADGCISGILDEILIWDSVSESWSEAGHMKTGRDFHGVTEVPRPVQREKYSASIALRKVWAHSEIFGTV